MDGTNGRQGSTLGVNVFTAPGKAMVGERPKPFGEALGFDPVTSTLISRRARRGAGRRDDDGGRGRSARRLGCTAQPQSGDHLHHTRSLRSLLWSGHPARSVPGCSGDRDTPDRERHAGVVSSAVERLARQLFPGQVPTKLVSPEPYARDTFTLEGHELRIIEQGRTDSPYSTCLHVPSDRPDRRRRRRLQPMPHVRRRHQLREPTDRIAALDRLAALNPAIVVAGHKKPGAPDSPSAIQDTKRYLLDFDRVQKTAASDQELFDQMTKLYPHWVANQSWLMFGFPQR